MNQEERVEEEILNDLPLASEQAEAAKAGSGTVTLTGPQDNAKLGRDRSEGLIYSGEPG